MSESSSDKNPAPPAASSERGGRSVERGTEKGADKRFKILDAAVRVFADKGYHDARISDIAREAGVAYGLVYHYFKNKEEILDKIFLDRWVGFIEAVEAIAQDGRKVEEKLLSIAALILSAYRARSAWVKVLVFEIQRSHRFADPTRIEQVSEFYALVAQMLREGQERGELRPGLDPDLASCIFIGGLDIVVTGRVLDLIEIDEREEATYHVKVARTVVDLFLHGVSIAAVADSAGEAKSNDESNG